MVLINPVINDYFERNFYPRKNGKKGVHYFRLNSTILEKHSLRLFYNLKRFRISIKYFM